jgi:Trp operon repressor
MNARILLVATVLVLVSGCQIRGQVDDTTGWGVESKDICVFVDQDIESGPNCNADIWLRYWSAVNTMTWPERKAQIESLSEDPEDTLKKVLLCQGKGTPFQNRLRAQSWLTSLMPMLSDEMQQFVAVAIYQPSQELLELESALVTLSEISTNQADRVEEQQRLLDQQQNQIELLLKIEASIMDNTRGDNQ